MIRSRHLLLETTLLVVSVLVVLLAWVLLSLGWPRLFPTPVGALLALNEMYHLGMLVVDISATFGRIIVGFFGGSVLGLILALLTSSRSSAGKVVTNVLHSWRPLPPVAMVYLVMILVGIERMPPVLIAISTMLPVWLNAHIGLTLVPRELQWTSDMYGAGAYLRVRRVMLPAAAKHIFAGLRTAVGTAFIVCIVAEFTAASEGIGFRIAQSYSVFRIDRTFALLLVLAISGSVADKLVRLLQRRLAPWMVAP